MSLDKQWINTYILLFLFLAGVPGLVLLEPHSPEIRAVVGAPLRNRLTLNVTPLISDDINNFIRKVLEELVLMFGDRKYILILDNNGLKVRVEHLECPD